MKAFLVSTLLFGLGVVSCLGAKGSKASSSSASAGQIPASASSGYSQPIVPSYAVPAQVVSPGRHDYYGQPMMAASTQADYYQPMDQPYVAASPGYGRS